jgi:hypothetical protein
MIRRVARRLRHVDGAGLSIPGSHGSEASSGRGVSRRVEERDGHPGHGLGGSVSAISCDEWKRSRQWM